MHGGGFPNYFSVIENAIKDILFNSGHSRKPIFDRLVVSVDAEENTYDQKRSDVESCIRDRLNGTYLDYKIIVQNFCLEAWCLGNRKIISKSNNNADLKVFTRHYDVRSSDPELLTPSDPERLTRAQHAKNYLRVALQNKHKNLTYTSSNPTALLNKKYYEQLKSRLIETQHIQSFQDFLDAFK